MVTAANALRSVRAMQNRILRRFLGTIVGILAALAVLYLVGLVDLALYPAPTLDPDGDAAAPALAMPLGAMLFVIAGWLLAPLVGVLIALRIDHWDASAWILIVLCGVASLGNAMLLPSSAWMEIASVVAPVAGGVIGLGLSRRWLARRYARGRVHSAGRGAAG
jgi:hypothetical protein